MSTAPNISIPKGETLWETYLQSGKPQYIVTSNKNRDTYFAYQLIENKLKKLGKARSPSDLRKFMKGV